MHRGRWLVVLTTAWGASSLLASLGCSANPVSRDDAGLPEDGGFVEPLDAGTDGDRDGSVAADGCGCEAWRDAGHDAGLDPEDGGPCERPIAGTGAFTQELSTSVTYTKPFDGGTVDTTETLDIYFPNGLTAGQTAILAAQSTWPYHYVVTSEATIQPDLSATFPRFSWLAGQEREADQIRLHADGSLTAALSRNFASDDAAILGTANALFCADGSTRGPSPLTYRSPRPMPLSTHNWSTEVPLDLTTFPAHPLRVAGHQVDASVVTSAGDVRVQRSAQTSLFAPGGAVTVEAPDLRDVLGRPVTIAATSDALATTATVSSLASEPPAGAVDTDGVLPTFQMGELYIDRGWGHGGYEMLVSIGTPPGGTTTMSIQTRLDCSLPGHITTTAALVATDGTATFIPLSCADTMQSADVTIPGAGPLWIAVYDNDSDARPQWLGLPPGSQLHLGGWSFH